MIKIVENDSIIALRDYCAGDPFGCRIMAAYNTYGLDAGFAEYWLQLDKKGRITAAVGRLDGGFTVCAKGKYDAEEMDLFLRTYTGENGALRPTMPGETAYGLVMRMHTVAPALSDSDVEINPPCEDLYSIIENSPELGYDIPNFETFYSDMKHRIRAGSALTALKRVNFMPVSCAAIHTVGSTALLVMCATVPDYQGKGHGTSCISALISRLPKNTDIYVMCSSGLCEFYESLGFHAVGGFRF